MQKKLFMNGILITVFLLLVGAVLAAVAPTTTTIPNQEWDATYPWDLDLSAYFTDADSDPLTYSFARTDNKSDIIVAISGSVATFTFTDDDFTGNNKFTFTATDNETTPLSVVSNEVTLTKNQPAYCESTEGTKIRIGEIDFDDDNYKIGDNVQVDIKDVEATTEDLEDVEVEVCIYNVGENKEVDCWDADGDSDINEDDESDYDVEFTLPNVEEIGDNDDYLLIVHVTADDEDRDNQCIQESDDMDIERDTHDVIVDSVRLSPSSVTAGETIQITARVENIGTSNEDDVYVELRDSILGIDYESNRFDLDDYTDSDNDHTVRFTFTVPETTAPGEYIIQPTVYFDDEDETSADEFAILTVKAGTPVGDNQVVDETVDLRVSAGNTQITTTSGSAQLHLIVNSAESRDLQGILSFIPVGNWADSLSGQPVSLHSGDNNLYFSTNLKDVQPGKHSATVSIQPIKNGDFEEKQFTLNFDVSGSESEESEGTFGGFFEGRSTTFWVIGDIILIIVALLIIKAVFSKKTL